MSVQVKTTTTPGYKSQCFVSPAGPLPPCSIWAQTLHFRPTCTLSCLQSGELLRVRSFWRRKNCFSQTVSMYPTRYIPLTITELLQTTLHEDVHGLLLLEIIFLEIEVCEIASHLHGDIETIDLYGSQLLPPSHLDDNSTSSSWSVAERNSKHRTLGANPTARTNREPSIGRGCLGKPTAE